MDVLPAISIDDGGVEHYSHVRRKVDKVTCASAEGMHNEYLYTGVWEL